MIHFDSEAVGVPSFITEQTAAWISRVINEFGKRVGEVRYIFCGDEYLYEINVNFLKHNTYTDIVTFNLSENPDYISGELFISLDRIAENAKINLKTFENEVFRVMIHGVLHLIGYNDKLESEIVQMRALEEKCLSLLP